MSVQLPNAEYAALVGERDQLKALNAELLEALQALLKAKQAPLADSLAPATGVPCWAHEWDQVHAAIARCGVQS